MVRQAVVYLQDYLLLGYLHWHRGGFGDRTGLVERGIGLVERGAVLVERETGLVDQGSGACRVCILRKEHTSRLL